MFELSKILVLLVAWVLMGCAFYWGTCYWYTIKVALLNCDDVDEIMAEFVNLMTHNVMGIKKTDKPKDIYRMVSSMTGEPVLKSWLRMYLVWPDTMAKVQPVMKEAYEILKQKYGLRDFKKSAT